MREREKRERERSKGKSDFLNDSEQVPPMLNQI